MAKVKVDYKDYFPQTMEQMCRNGLLLVTKGKNHKANIMTIGWGTIGSIWGKPVFIVLVRPSRYTYKLLEEITEFTVNVPSDKLAEAVNYCGMMSGRDLDKFQEMQLTPIPLQEVQVPIIEECHIHYACRILHHHNLIPENLDSSVKKRFYPKDDFHRVYYGEILATYADKALD
jgi:flavin reductase (DIM6/NTAB) family NADH-FMN oxidoreductase RutF